MLSFCNQIKIQIESDAGYWILVSGFWILVSGYWILDMVMNSLFFYPASDSIWILFGYKNLT